MKSRCIFFFFIFSAFHAFAQHDTILPDLSPRFFISSSAQYGFIWAHRPSMTHLIKKHIDSFEIDICHTSDGSRAWQAPYHFPWNGIAVQFINLGNPEQLGNAIGVYPFANFPLGKRDRNFKMHLRFGWGLGYITKPFDPLENHKNVAIGSHLNTCFSLRLNGMWKLNDNNYMEFGLGMTHFSNGAMTLPNLGINLPMVSVGYNFYAWEGIPWHKISSMYDLDDPAAASRIILADRKWHVNALLVTGMNDINPPGGRRFGVLNVKSSVMKQTSRKSRWGVGLDLMYSQAIQHKLNYADSNDAYVNVMHAMQPGIKICYEWVLGRITFPVEFGYYIRTQYKTNGYIYNRFAVHYLIGEHLIAEVSIKTHLVVAEYFEFGAGWRF